MTKDNRFIKTYAQGSVNVSEIWVDKETGINYFFHYSGYSAGLTVLLDENGNPVVTPIKDL